MTSNRGPTTKTENTRQLEKKINKNSPNRIGSKTSWLSVTKSNTVTAFADGTNNNSTNALNSPTSNGNSNFNENFDSNEVEIFENHREGTVSTIERSRRSLVERSDHVGEQVPSSVRFNRHPNLSYEERQKQLNHTMEPRNTNQNLGTAMNKRVDKFESFSSKEGNARSRVSVFSNCDDTKNFETNDSKGNREQNFKGDSDGEKDFSQKIQNLQSDETSIKPKRKNKRIAMKNRNSKKDLSESQEIENSQNDKDTSSETFQDRNKSYSSIKKDKRIAANNRNTREKDFSESQKIGHLQNDKNVLNVTFRDKLQGSIKKEKEDKHYIDIRDHQKNVKNFEMSSEIPEYDPNKIPYVEVPDYSDIREECLDEEDRKEKKEGKADFVDPEVSIDSEEYSYNDSPEEISEIELKNSKGDSSEESNSSSSNELDKSKANEDKSDADLTNFNRFPNAGQRDKSDKDKSLESLGFGQNSERESLSMDFGESSEFFDREEEDKSEVVRTKDSKENSYLEERESSEESSREESTRARQVDSESESGPIIFDVNEYRKPFDLDEFLKDDPIMKKLYQLEKETRTKYGENGKRVPSDFDESDSDNTTFTVRANNAQLRDTLDDQPKSYGSSNFARIDERMRDEEENIRHDDFMRIFRNGARDSGRRESHYNRDEETKSDFPKFNFKGGKADKLKENKGYKIEKKRGNTRDTGFSNSSKISERHEEDLPTVFEILH